MAEQTTMFDDWAEKEMASPKVHPDERPRLSGQCRAILELLQQGRVTNSELAKIALKYTSRISDIRKAGYEINVVTRNHTTGLTEYELVQ